MFKKKVPEKNELTKADVAEMVKNCKIYKTAECPPNPFRVESIPTARIIDKYAHDNNLQVIKGYLNPTTKSITYIHVVGINEETTTEIPYEKVCENFGWTKFSISENLQTAYPKWTD